MAFRSYALLRKDFTILLKTIVRHRSQRRTLGKPPEIARNLQTRLEEINFKDPNIFFKVDIGFPYKKHQRKEALQEHIAILKKNKSDLELQKLSKNNELILSLQEVEEEWLKTNGPLHIKAAAEYYGVFEHLYGDAYFIPCVNLKINYELDNGYVPVYRGNHIKPEQATTSPIVGYEAPKDSQWTLVMTSPDGHFSDENCEYVHWLVGNIKGSEVQSGDVIQKYLQPFPVKGAGYYRYIFVLYKQTGTIDYSSFIKQSESFSLESRTFSTYDFYRERQDVLTPAGLAFFQAEWDNTVTDFFRNILGIGEPEYCYDFPKHYYRKQEWFPIGQPFNLYLDRYRDEKQIAKEYVIKKLKATHPFKGPDPPLNFPNAVPFKKGTPSWLKLELKKERIKWGRVNDY